MPWLQRSSDDAHAGLQQLVLVRHGESMGNLADAAARRRRAGRLELDVRDADVELSPTGFEQAEAVGRYLAGLGDDERPTAVLTSPFRRAAATASTALTAAGCDLPLLVDERLRERDLGAFDGLTAYGIREAFPTEAEQRGKVGKFYYRPPGGESWCDVALRVRTVLADLRQPTTPARVWVFTHQAVIMSFRLALEHLSEHDLLEADRSTPVANCSLTVYQAGDGGVLSLTRYGDTAAVDRVPAPVTREAPSSDAADAAS